MQLITTPSQLQINLAPIGPAAGVPVLLIASQQVFGADGAAMYANQTVTPIMPADCTPAFLAAINAKLEPLGIELVAKAA